VLDAGVDWKEVAALVERSYRLVAPKRGGGRHPSRLGH